MRLVKRNDQNFKQEFDRTKAQVLSDLQKAMTLVVKAEKEIDTLSEVLFMDKQESKASALPNKFIKAYDAVESTRDYINKLKLKTIK